jgi:hypothetical protein
VSRAEIGGVGDDLGHCIEGGGVGGEGISFVDERHGRSEILDEKVGVVGWGEGERGKEVLTQNEKTAFVGVRAEDGGHSGSDGGGLGRDDAAVDVGLEIMGVETGVDYCTGSLGSGGIELGWAFGAEAGDLRGI